MSETPAVPVAEPGLTPNQRRIWSQLLDRDGLVPRPVFDDGLADRLREELEAGLEPHLSRLGQGTPLTVNKFTLGYVHTCEGRFRAERSKPFDWTIAKLRGRVAHRAIEASIMSSRDSTPLDLIDRSLERISQDGDGAAEFLGSLSAIEVGQLKGEANDAVLKFLSDWPPISRRWIPRVESTARVSLGDGAVSLRAKYDLAFGQPNGMEARVLIVDFKTGGEYGRYADDLRFYALVETLRTGVPPFRIASYYLDAGTFQVESVTEDLIASAMRRTVDGVRTMLEVAAGREPALSPGAWCRYCPAKDECVAGMHHLASQRNQVDEA